MGTIIGERPSVLKSSFENERIENQQYKFNVKLSINFPVSTFNSIVHFLVVSGVNLTRREEYHVTYTLGKPQDPNLSGQADYEFEVVVDEQVLKLKNLSFEASNTKDIKNSPEGFIEVKEGVFFNNSLPINLSQESE
ncbi:hypothetical protein AB3K25_04255 [Leuconostoc sp. MS02]|uniref:Uncharacterized protein n=1 Tax=Leuconostoc aquikimchii TaxID=3236804 RepID=A0ABV3S351_9LACO